MSKKEAETKAKEESSDALVQRTICISPEAKLACDLLVYMHTFKRPAWSKTERHFINNFVQPLGGRFDKFGNWYKRIGDAPILWASHTDTVHTKKGMQTVGFDKMEIGIAAEDKSNSNCLGADDTVGVWLMMQLIVAKKPGLYIFHREEEGGRKGSRWIAEHNKEIFKDINFAVALDRKGTDNFITHQMSQRCCSDAFGNSFIAELKEAGLEYKLDTTGSYTDTASYTDLVAECTNISVGYSGAHSSNERLDLGHAFKLRDALLKLDVSKLVKSRKPGTVEYKTYSYSSGYSSGTYRAWDGWGGYGGGDEDFDGAWIKDEKTGVWRINPNQAGTRFNRSFDHQKGTASGTQVGTRNGHTGSNLPVTKQNSELRKMFGGGSDSRKPINLPAIGPPAAAPIDEDEEMTEEQMANDSAAMVKLVQRNPDAVADILEQFGVSAETLRDEILETMGVCNC